MKPLVAGLRQRTTVDCDQASDYNVKSVLGYSKPLQADRAVSEAHYLVPAAALHAGRKSVIACFKGNDAHALHAQQFQWASRSVQTAATPTAKLTISNASHRVQRVPYRKGPSTHTSRCHCDNKRVPSNSQGRHSCH